MVQCIDDGATAEGSEVTDSALSQLQLREQQEVAAAAEAEFAAKFVEATITSEASELERSSFHTPPGSPTNFE